MEKIEAIIFKPNSYMPVDSTSQLLRYMSLEFKDNTICAKTRGGELKEIIVGGMNEVDSRVIRLAKEFHLTYSAKQVTLK